MSDTYLVIGGNGRTGRSIVAKLHARGQAVHMMARHIRPSNDVIVGDITDATRVAEAMRGVVGVVIIVESGEQNHGPNSPRSVHYEGILHVLETATPQTHIVLVTQIYITRPERYPEVHSIIHWRGQGEVAVRASGNPYTIVRPSWLIDQPGGHSALRLEQGDTGDGKVSREDIAEICVQALLHPEARGKTFEVYAQPGTPPNDWARVFDQLASDEKEEKA